MGTRVCRVFSTYLDIRAEKIEFLVLDHCCCLIDWIGIDAVSCCIDNHAADLDIRTQFVADFYGFATCNELIMPCLENILVLSCSIAFTNP